MAVALPGGHAQARRAVSPQLERGSQSMALPFAAQCGHSLAVAACGITEQHIVQTVCPAEGSAYGAAAALSAISRRGASDRRALSR